ncbi:MAG: type II toxin-antitoxin system VapC family toxin [Chloroflexi bacterium]|nr:type II toxin-antitoxin system VapC family toxin [Chloroflexota bacterium]
MVVLDTSTILFWIGEPKKLSSAAIKTIAEADRLLISSISVWEIGVKMRKGRLVLPRPLSELVDRLQRAPNVEILPVDVPTWMENVALDWSHKDPADRTIVATAVLNTCPLITSDRVIRAFYENAIW